MPTASCRPQVPTPSSTSSEMPSATPTSSCQVPSATSATPASSAASAALRPKNHDHHHDRDQGGHEHHGSERLQPVEVVDFDAFHIGPPQRDPLRAVARATRHDLFVDAYLTAVDLLGP